jgi:DNA mismatch repair protein MSH3
MPSASSSKNSQRTLSTFFQASPRKRDSSFIDLTQDDEPDSTAQKRIRLSATTADTSGESRSRDTLADSWRFSPEKAKQTTSSTPSASEKQRHEAFKRKLLQDNSLFLRNKSEDTEEGQADEPHASDGLPEADERFEKLHEMFAHKSSVQAKGKAKQESLKKKKPVDIGPSGEPYTPLEKQVC